MILSDGPFSETPSRKMTFTAKLVILPRNYRDICDFHREIYDFYREITTKFTIFTAKLPRNLVCRGTAKFRKIYRYKFLSMSRSNKIFSTIPTRANTIGHLGPVSTGLNETAIKKVGLLRPAEALPKYQISPSQKQIQLIYCIQRIHAINPFLK